ERLTSPTRVELYRALLAKDGRLKSVSVESFQPQYGELTVISRKTPEIVEKLSNYCVRKEKDLRTVSDQPIGKTPRSNPATYTGLATKIRNLMAKSPEAKSLELGKSAFSFNNKRG